MTAASTPAAAGSPTPTAHGRRRLAIVVNPKNALATLSPRDVREIFLANRQFWSGGVRIVAVFEKPGSEQHEAFLTRVAEKSSDEFRTIYTRKLYIGILSTKVEVYPTAAEVRAAVAGSPNAIGYLFDEEVDGSVRVVAEFP